LGFWDFVHQNSFGMFLVFCIACGTVCALADKTVRAYRFKLRARNIQLHGWPQPPIDADGDVVAAECTCTHDQQEAA
jgi:hypothetical protein